MSTASWRLSHDGPRRPRGATRTRKIVGRGTGSGRGSTAGRGTKGQNARSGGGVRLGFEGGQMPLFRRVARRGCSNVPFKQPRAIVNIGALERFSDGDVVDAAALEAAGLVKSAAVPVKVLGNGELTRTLEVHVAAVSASARSRIEAAGGSVVIEEADAALPTGDGA